MLNSIGEVDKIFPVKEQTESVGGTNPLNHPDCLDFVPHTGMPEKDIDPMSYGHLVTDKRDGASKQKGS